MVTLRIFAISDSFGISGLKHFQKLAARKDICIADIIEDGVLLRGFSEDEEDEDSISILDIMPSYREVDVIVCYCSPQLMTALFQVIRGHDRLKKRFVVIGG